jgi:hypothetical protein
MPKTFFFVTLLVSSVIVSAAKADDFATMPAPKKDGLTVEEAMAMRDKIANGELAQPVLVKSAQECKDLNFAAWPHYRCVMNVTMGSKVYSMEFDGSE